MITKTKIFIFFSLFFALGLITGYFFLKNENQSQDYVTIAILAKDKAHSLPLYLESLEKQTWPKDKTYLYIRTNNNNDETPEILRQWIKKVNGLYAGIYFDDSDVSTPVQNYKQHEWNAERFKVLGKIRQDSVDYAKERGSHYFVADCDNFIIPETIESLAKSNLPIVAPFLRASDTSGYSNYHAAIDQNGYFADTPLYYEILSNQVKGLVEVPVVHCTYFIQNNVLDKMSYDDNSYRYEYVIFSDTARKEKIPQYLDNRKLYGRITFTENSNDLSLEPWLHEFQEGSDKIKSIFTSIYKHAEWAKNNEGKGSSGEGSKVQNTIEYRNYLKKFLKESKVSSVVDIGCGDWEFSKLIDWSNIHYTGYDVVKDLIEMNQKKFGSSSIHFVHDNFLMTKLPTADLLICKDVFQHLSNEEIMSFLPNLNEFKLALIINDINPLSSSSDNLDIQTGGYRPLDLTKEPFNVKGTKVLEFNSGYVKKQILLIAKNDN